MSCSSESCALLVDFYQKFCTGAELKFFEWEELLGHLVGLDYAGCDSHIDRLLTLTVDHPIIRKYPLKPTFQKGFLKHFLNLVEERGLTHDVAYERLVTLLAEPEADSELHYRHFPLKNRFITIQESRNIISQGTTGLHTWQAGIALANWGIRNKEHFHFKRVLELGCGLGLTGLALIFSDSPPLSYTFSDCHPDVLQLLKGNIILNAGTEGDDVPKRINKTNVQVLDFNWSEQGGPRLSKLFQPDVIIAADVVYDCSLIPQLCSTIKTLISSAKAYSLVACTVRSEETVDHFLESLGETGLEVSEDEDEEEEVASLGKKDAFFHSNDLPVKIFKITLVSNPFSGLCIRVLLVGIHFACKGSFY